MMARPQNEYSAELVKQLLYRFMEERQVTGLLKYNTVLNFARDLFENGELEDAELTKEHFWRKGAGRKAIDERNKVLEYQVPSGKKNDEKVIDTTDAIDKYFTGKEKDKQTLSGLLNINENKLKRYIQENNKLREKLNQTEQSLAEQKEKTNEWKKKADDYQRILFMWLEASIDEDVPLVNVLTTGKSRHPIVNHLFETIFSDNPVEGYEMFEEFRTKPKQKEITQDDNKIVSIQNKVQRTAFDDISF